MPIGRPSVWFLLTVAAGSHAQAFEYTLPTEPFAPQSREECDQLRDEYHSVANSIIVEAKGVLQEIYQTPTSSHRSHLHQRHDELMRKHHTVVMARIDAYYRCLENVRNRVNDSENELINTNRNRDAAPKGYITSLKDEAMSRLLPGKSVFDNISALNKAYDAMRGQGSSHDRLTAIVGITLPTISNYSGWSDLQSFLVQNALDSAIEINRAATDDFTAAMEEFNKDPTSTASRFANDVQQAMKAQRSLVDSERGQFVDPSDKLIQLEAQVTGLVDTMYVQRREAYEKAMREARDARERRAATQAREVSRKRAGHTTTVTRRSYDPVQCQIDRDQLEFAQRFDTPQQVQNELDDLRRGNCP